DAGVLRLPEAGDDPPTLLAGDDSGRIYAAGRAQSWRVAGDEVRRCDVGGEALAVDDEGGVVLATGGELVGIDFEPVGCARRFRLDEEGLRLRGRFAAFAGGRLWVAPLRVGPDRLLTAYEPDGRKAPVQLGKEGERDPIVRTRALLGDQRSLAVVDAHARRLRFFAADGSRRGSIDLLRLLDLPLPWVAGATRSREGVAFLAVGHERGERSGLFEGLLFRVQGL
ncbi:MAG: hypothetical protein AAGH15_26355, partial [Myxococcota bacterium]